MSWQNSSKRTIKTNQKVCAFFKGKISVIKRKIIAAEVHHNTKKSFELEQKQHLLEMETSEMYSAYLFLLLCLFGFLKFLGKNLNSVLQEPLENL